MRAEIHQDIIVSVAPHGGVEIGDLPPGVGLERLRWDGKRVVDLADREEIWVKHIHPDIFELHAVTVPGARLVRMRYSDRHRLTVDAGGIRLKTAEEMELERAELGQRMLKARFRADLAGKVGDLGDQHADLAKIVYLLVRVVAGQDQAALALLTEILSDLAATYPQDKLSAEIPAFARAIREEMQRYYTEKVSISERSISG